MKRLYNHDEESLNKTANEILTFGRRAWTMQVDLADTIRCEEACRKAISDTGPIDILINNVGSPDGTTKRPKPP